MGDTDDDHRNFKRKESFEDESQDHCSKKCRVELAEANPQTPSASSAELEPAPMWTRGEDMETEDFSTVTSVGEDERLCCRHEQRQEAAPREAGGEFVEDMEVDTVVEEQTVEAGDDATYVLSSGRPRFEDSMAKAPTIDDEFEQYFASQLML